MRALKFLLVCVLAVTVALAFASCARKPVSETMIIGTTDKVIDMDTANAYDFHTWNIMFNIYQGLWAYEPGTTDLVPALAESYEIGADGKEYTFKLREGLKFSDGTPLTAEIVKWSVDRVIALKGDPSWLVTDFVDRVEAVDDLHVKFVLKNPVAYFPSLVTSPPYYPVNPKVYPQDRVIRDPSELTGGQLVGLGPYNCVSFKRDQELILETNPNFYGPKPKTHRIVIRYFADATTLRLAIEKGEIDIAFRTLNPSDVADLEKSKKIKTIKAQGPYIRYLCFLCANPPFNDKVLRQAVTAAIDREEILDKVFLGQNAPLYSMVPMGMWSHTDNFKDVYGDGNIEKAKELLASKGYTEDKKFAFTLWYTPSHYGDTEVDTAAVMEAQLEATGVMDVTVKSAEWATYRDQWHNKQMQAYLLGWYPDYMDPDNYTAAFAGTAGSAGLGVYFSDPAWDKILNQGQTVADEKERTKIYEEIQKMWAEDIPTAPIYQGTLYCFTKLSVEGVKLSPTLRFHYDLLYMK